MIAGALDDLRKALEWFEASAHVNLPIEIRLHMRLAARHVGSAALKLEHLLKGMQT
jgi:hypothetical protein